jgi:hypothetical protein
MELLQQTDTRWSKNIIGQSGFSIGGSGCVLTSLCNAANLQGYDWTPDDLNRALYSQNGLTDNGYVIWDIAAKLLKCNIKPFYNGEIDFNNRKESYICHYQNRTSNGKLIGHFTNLLGRQGGYYIIFDVYDGKTLVKPVKDIDRIVKVGC